MYGFTRDDLDLEAVRQRPTEMSDEALVRYGRSAAWMAEHSDRETWLLQLSEARAERRRRRFKKPSDGQPG